MARAGGRAALVVLLALAGCATAPDPPPPAPPQTAAPAPATSPPRKVSPYAPAQEDLSKRGDYTAGGLYAPGVADSAPDELPKVDLIPEPEIVAEPRSRYGNRSPYTVLGKSYRVMDSPEGYVEEGIASYYGQKFHGRRTSSLEVYDMYAFSAAHKTLPLPSYARVTNLHNGESVVVRVNDRGPFHPGRIIDLSYAAAVKLGIHTRGTARVEVRALVPEPPAPGASASTVVTAPAGSAPAPGMSTPATPATPAPAPSGMDALVATLPVGAAAAVEPDRGVMLQVASFSSRRNAEHALARLEAVGITGARVLEAVAGRESVWRLRIGPLSDAEAAALAPRLSTAGFDAPRVLSPE